MRRVRRVVHEPLVRRHERAVALFTLLYKGLTMETRSRDQFYRGYGH